MRGVSADDSVIYDDHRGARDLLSTPLLSKSNRRRSGDQERDRQEGEAEEEEDDDDTDDSSRVDSRLDRDRLQRDGEESAASGYSSSRTHRQYRNGHSLEPAAPRGRHHRDGRIRGGGSGVGGAPLPILKRNAAPTSFKRGLNTTPINNSMWSGSFGAGTNGHQQWQQRPTVRRSSIQQQDYRSEGEQPSTARDGNRHHHHDNPSLSNDNRQDSFRAARMPKRGGRNRLRRVRSIRRKIRVSSYCVARGLKTLQLLRWLETQPNRRLSQSLRAQGGAAPRGPVGAVAAPGTVSKDTVAASTESRTRTAMGRIGLGGGLNVEESRPGGALAAMYGATSANTGALGGGTRGRNSMPATTIDQLEWMDSLYIDVIHSTTDIRGGLRKARDLDRSSLEDAQSRDRDTGQKRGGDGSDGERSYDAGIDDDRGEGQWERRGDGEQDEDDDDVVTHKDVIFFPYGAVVFWGCSEVEEKEMLSSLNRFMETKVSDTELAESFDDMTFVYRHRDIKESVPLKNDEITLDTRDPAEKLAYSCALAQSAKLFVFEERLNNIIESTAKYPQILAATGKIPLTEIQIGRLVGQVLCEQNEVNLHSDILDTPEYFWEEDAWEPAYEALGAYLDIPLRVDNLNTRLGILRELLDVLSTQSTNTHATRLEVIIIYLILIEVAIELVWDVIIKDIFHLVGDRCF